MVKSGEEISGRPGNEPGRRQANRLTGTVENVQKRAKKVGFLTLISGENPCFLRSFFDACSIFFR